MILLYITSRTVCTGVFRVECDIFQVANDIFEMEHCSISFRVAYDFGKKVSIVWLLQGIHSETKKSCDFVIYYKSQRVHRAYTVFDVNSDWNLTFASCVEGKQRSIREMLTPHLWIENHEVSFLFE